MFLDDLAPELFAYFGKRQKRCKIELVENREGSFANCIVPFPNGIEYDIQGIDDWNPYNWRWLQNQGKYKFKSMPVGSTLSEHLAPNSLEMHTEK